jgi:DNA invertase Pin-like site-specific DNA recombinase
MFVRAYLRASTTNRMRTALGPLLRPSRLTTASQSQPVCRERERREALPPELFRLLADARPGDMLLVEQVDRLSRLTASDWSAFVVSLLPSHRVWRLTSHVLDDGERQGR